MKRPLQFTITFTILLTAPIYSPLSWALPIDDFRSESLFVLGTDTNELMGVSRPHFTSKLASVAEMRSVRLPAQDPRLSSSGKQPSFHQHKCPEAETETG